MPITAISHHSLGLLSSSQILTTPVALIKELIDNCIDARASSIDISISANTLDKIEVRDNGSGIDSVDFSLIGKRGHTSKLRAFEELRRLGGTSLGFRGEALASAVELSGEVAITTRTEGDAVATLLKLKAPDGVYSHTKASHPVGTTVCVQNFLSKLPVRKQAALKEAAKTLSGAKELLKSYALARPHVKLSLKINGKGNWSFSPRPHDGMKEAVMAVIGRELASQCVEATHSSSRSLPDEDAPNSQETMTTTNDHDASFEMHAFLPKAGTTSKISGGSFISVDARPINCKRGLGKKIISIYKEHLRASLSFSDKLKDPFIRLNIVCPSGSYDLNVEPAKDDLLFANELAVISLARSLFASLYGEIKTNVTAEKKEPLKAHNGFDLLMARKPVTAASQNRAAHISRTSLLVGSPSVGQQVHPPMEVTIASGVLTSIGSPLKDMSDESLSTGMEETLTADVDDGKRKWGFNMAKGYEEPEGQLLSRATSPQPAPPDLDSEIESPRASLINPWTIAKLNAPVMKRAANGASEDGVMQMPSRSANLLTPRRSSEPSSATVDIAGPGGSNYRQSASKQIDLNDSYAAWVERQEKTRRLPSTPEDHQSGSNSLPLDDLGGEKQFQTTVTQHRNRGRGGFVVARDLPISGPRTLSPTQPAMKKQRQSGFNKPFKAPKRSSAFVAVNGRESSQRSDTSFHQSTNTANFGQTPQNGASLPQSSEPGVSRAPENTPHRDLQYSLDFEQRKEDLNRKQRLEARAPASRPSPHQNRYNAAIAVLDAVSNTVVPSTGKDREPFKTSLPDGDPRAYLFRRRKSMSIIENHPEKGVKLKKAKTMLLPLESIPRDFQVHNLVGTISTDLYAICQAVVEVTTEDEYVRSGMLGKAFDLEVSEVAEVRQWLIKACVKRGLIGESQGLDFDLSGLKK